MLGASINAKPLLEHVLAHGLDFESVEEMHEADCVHFRPLFAHLLKEVFLDGAHLALTLELALDEKSCGKSFATFGAHEVHLVGRLGDILDILVGLAEGAAHLDLEVDDLFDFLVCALEGGDEILVANLAGGAFHHEELAAQTRIEEVDIALGLLLVRGVDHPLAVDAPDAHAADGTHERNLGDVQGCRSGVHGEEVAFTRSVGLYQGGVHLHIVVVTIREQGADGAVAHAGGEDFLARRARFTLEESAGELARGIELLAIFALEREEVYPLARRIRVCDGREDRRIAVTDRDCPGGLLRQEPGLYHQIGAGDVDFELFRSFHWYSLS